ncbi:hypothetical protein [Nocardia sp. BMG111209]|uniref:hypothetical protein n=1 Tax=Nocardia sp. BMG111209 TaxID=1160137 RepID=UPI000366CF13|nr:hypothetical protein [Nocardia sp. BMG111209]
MKDIVFVVTFASCWFSAGSIWMAQHNWILFRRVGPAEFGAFHAAWLRGLYWAGVPMVLLALIGNAAQLHWRPAHTTVALVVAALVLQVLVLVATAVWWGPAQQRMHFARRPDDSLDPGYRRLCDANWLRVVAVSAVAVLQAVLLAEALP